MNTSGSLPLALFVGVVCASRVVNCSSVRAMKFVVDFLGVSFPLPLDPSCPSILVGFGVSGDRGSFGVCASSVTGLAVCFECCLDRFSERACSSASLSSGRLRVLSMKSQSPSESVVSLGVAESHNQMLRFDHLSLPGCNRQ